MTMARDLARALDPVVLARDAGFELDPWQAKLMRDAPDRALLNCCRQSGKSTTTGLMALQVALYSSTPALVVIVSPSQRQSVEMLRSIVGYHAKLEGAMALNAESALRAELANGSRIVALPGSERTVRGLSAAALIIVDEAARCDDALIAAVRPMLAVSKGKLLMLSTPAGKRGFWFEAWANGSDDWVRISVPASECPRITKEFLDEELRELGQARFAEEYLLQFYDDEEAAFPTAIIEAAFSQEVASLWRH